MPGGSGERYEYLFTSLECNYLLQILLCRVRRYDCSLESNVSIFALFEPLLNPLIFPNLECCRRGISTRYLAFGHCTRRRRRKLRLAYVSIHVHHSAHLLLKRLSLSLTARRVSYASLATVCAMPITSAQKAAIEEVITRITSMHSSERRKYQLAGMFLELVDRKDWSEYYEVN